MIVPAIRYAPAGSGELSIKPTFRGASIDWEAKCQSGTLYALNSNHVYAFVHQDANFMPNEAGMQNPINQDAFVMPVLWQGNMITNLRNALGKLTGIT